MSVDLVKFAAASLGAVAADGVPGLWHLPGHPELTSGQLIDLFGRMAQNAPLHASHGFGFAPTIFKPL